MNNLLSYCGLIDERMSTSDKDLPVQKVKSLVRPFRWPINLNQVAFFLVAMCVRPVCTAK